MWRAARVAGCETPSSVSRHAMVRTVWRPPPHWMVGAVAKVFGSFFKKNRFLLLHRCAQPFHDIGDIGFIARGGGDVGVAAGDVAAGAFGDAAAVERGGQI